MYSDSCGGGRGVNGHFDMSEFNKENISQGKTLTQLSQLPVQPKPRKNKKKSASSATGTTRPHRPLPLRKRKLNVNFETSDEDEYRPPMAMLARGGMLDGSDRKRDLVRHNMRNEEEGGRVTCKCSKSKCLKVRDTMPWFYFTVKTSFALTYYHCLALK